jgi:hypothetical protein
MKPYIHAKSSAAKYGGQPEDYLVVHDLMDSSKAALADVRHRALFHSAFGIFMVEKIIGTTLTNSDGRKVSVRDIAEQHVMEDLGFIPTVETWFKNMSIEPWMHGAVHKRGTVKHIPMNDGNIQMTEVQNVFID